MNRHHVTLSEPVSKAVRAQVKSGRYKDFSSAVQAAAWHYFVEQSALFEEYGVEAGDVERAAMRDLEEIRRDRRIGRLKAWKS